MPKALKNPQSSSNKVGITVIQKQSLISPHLEKPPLLASDLTSIGTPDIDKLQIIVGSQAFLKIDQHTRSDMTREVGGFLVGKPYEWHGKKYVEIIDSVPAEATSSSAVHLTISPNTWLQAQNLLREKFPDMYIVGWYHTHPHMALFLSSQDMAIHEGFFREDWHVALVLDPTRREAAFFIWDQERVRLAAGYEINYPSERSTSDRWMPSTRTYRHATGTVFDDFYQVGSWHTRSVEGDDLLVKVRRTAFDALVQRESSGVSRYLPQIGICIGGYFQKNREITHSASLVDIWQMETVSTRIKEVFASSIAFRKLGELLHASFDKIESVQGIYIVWSNPPNELLETILKNWNFKSLIIVSDGLPGSYMKCAWKNRNGKIIEREMAEMMDLSEFNEKSLEHLMVLVGNACDVLRP